MPGCTPRLRCSSATSACFSGVRPRIGLSCRRTSGTTCELVEMMVECDGRNFMASGRVRIMKPKAMNANMIVTEEVGRVNGCVADGVARHGPLGDEIRDVNPRKRRYLRHQDSQGGAADRKHEESRQVACRDLVRCRSTARGLRAAAVDAPMDAICQERVTPWTRKARDSGAYNKHAGFERCSTNCSG